MKTRRTPALFRPGELSLQEGLILDIDLRGHGRRGPRPRLLPEPKVLEDLPDDVLLLDEGDDLHGAPAFGAEQRVHLVDLADQPQSSGS